jgi:hypothetical protein
VRALQSISRAIEATAGTSVTAVSGFSRSRPGYLRYVLRPNLPFRTHQQARPKRALRAPPAALNAHDRQPKTTNTNLTARSNGGVHLHHDSQCEVSRRQTHRSLLYIRYIIGGRDHTISPLTSTVDVVDLRVPVTTRTPASRAKAACEDPRHRDHRPFLRRLRKA